MPRRNRVRLHKIDGAERIQKGKGGKRRRRLHHSAGSSEARYWDSLPELPDVGTGADPTAGAPQPLRERTTRGPNRGSTLR